MQHSSRGRNIDASNNSRPAGIVEQSRFVKSLAALAGNPLLKEVHASTANSKRDVYIVPILIQPVAGGSPHFERNASTAPIATSLILTGRRGSGLCICLVGNQQHYSHHEFLPGTYSGTPAANPTETRRVGNAMFLEPTINLSGGEVIVRMGVVGLRWYGKVFDLQPRYA